MKRILSDQITLIWYRTEVEAKFVSRRLLSLAVREFCDSVGVSEKDVVFDSNGKPYFTDFPGYHLSISHAGDLLVFVFAPFPIGVDVERIREIRPAVAERYFSKEEMSLPFSEVWTAKEAVGKLTGVGLSDALQTRVERGTATLAGQEFVLLRERIEECLITVAKQKRKDE